MSKLHRVTRGDGSTHGFAFQCPGCGGSHVVPTTGPNAWGFNGDEERPTFTPSILVYPSKRYDEAGTVVDTPRCHSFVTDGRIQFCGDSTHALAGQTVDVPEWRGEFMP